jgi:hypothetical protein
VTETSQIARAGDAERDGCIRTLTAALVDGQLDHAEFGERSSAALLARTRGELDLLTQDLESPESRLSTAASHRAPGAGKMDPLLTGGYVAVSGVLSVLVLGLLVLDDAFYGILLWLFSLVCGGAGALLARRNHR